MGTPLVRFRLPDGRRAKVPAGGIVGRLATAACRLEDGRVSEAHLLISLRGRELRALRLRGELRTEEGEEEEVALQPGMHLTLAPGVVLEVEAVELPAEVLALQLPDGSLRELCAPCYSLLGAPKELLPGWEPEADAWVWSSSEGWRLRVAGGPAEEIRPGKSWDIGGFVLRAQQARVEDLEAAWTQRSGHLQGLTIVSRFSSVQILQGRKRPVSLDGIPARILAELGTVRGPLPWHDVARQLWRKEPDRVALRRNWDRGVRRLRLALREAGIREDLVRADGLGGFELLLYVGDRFVEEEEV